MKIRPFRSIDYGQNSVEKGIDNTKDFVLLLKIKSKSSVEKNNDNNRNP